MRPILISLLFGLCALMACYQPRGGCIDPNAVNFDVNADLDTGCIYPNMVLEVSHLHNNTGVNLGGNYLNNKGQYYQILDVAYYLSGFKFGSGLQEYTLQDTFQAFRKGTPNVSDSVAVTAINDIALLRRNTVSYTIGGFREEGQFDRISCDFGLRTELTDILPGSVTSGFSLSPQSEQLYDSVAFAYRFARIIYRADSSTLTKPDTMWLSGQDFAGGAPKITQSVNMKHVAGFDFKVKLSVDYSFWFANVDFSKPKPDIIRQITNDLQGSFLFSQ